ncbi:ClpP/crotonase-like domain-containing protein [Kockovaella imperatae]|uniref:ClpP/crotonase-like domain-containing protein n=1 Tax=Kockovaella imperatae TaxID=4999 RepID=A0A1Y1UPZ9_9TREE|nr:ClpP/crotonase-like domain-containing protein [Kockovaella imperatae]ORX40140.1 ClpP/crotonase-like domain-containing protein [Kockovaella imperatae]
MDLAKTKWDFHRCSLPSEGVLLVEFDRAPVNAFHDEMWTELRHVMHHASLNPGVRCVVLASKLNKGFTAGLDIKDQLAAMQNYPKDPGRQALVLLDHLRDFQDAISSLAECRAPVIAALHGICFGLGLDIASACDIRLAAENTTFRIAEVDVGLAADIGTLQRFPKIIGNDSKARELALTARSFGAHEAKEFGFLSKVVKGDREAVTKAALEVAKQIAEKSPIAVLSTKHLMNHARDHSVREGLEYTQAWNMGMLQTEDVSNAMKGVLSKKQARFAPVPLIQRVKAKL